MAIIKKPDGGFTLDESEWEFPLIEDIPEDENENGDNKEDKNYDTSLHHEIYSRGC